MIAKGSAAWLSVSTATLTSQVITKGITPCHPSSGHCFRLTHFPELSNHEVTGIYASPLAMVSLHTA